MLLTWASRTLNRFSCSFNPLKYLDKLSTLWKESKALEQKGKVSEEIIKYKLCVALLQAWPFAAVLCCSDIPQPPKSFVLLRVHRSIFLGTAASLECSHAPVARGLTNDRSGQIFSLWLGPLSLSCCGNRGQQKGAALTFQLFVSPTSTHYKLIVV